MPATSVEELRMIVAVAHLGSLTAAAASLGVSQQAVSQRMRRVERRWGLPLFDRGARGTRLTAQGTLVAEWADAVLGQLDAFDSAVGALRTDRDAHVRIAASLTVAEHLVPGWLVTYAAEPERARVELTAVNSATVVERVRAGADDLGFIETPDIPDGLATRSVGSDEVVLVVAPSHAWARRTLVTRAEAARTPVVGREPGSGTRLTLERALGDAVEPAAELATTAAIRATVMAGTGVGALSILAVRDDLAAGRLARVPLEGESLTRPLTAIWRADRPLPSGAARMLELASSSQRAW